MILGLGDRGGGSGLSPSVQQVLHTGHRTKGHPAAWSSHGQYLRVMTPAPVVNTGTPSLHFSLASCDGLDHELSLRLEQVS